MILDQDHQDRLSTELIVNENVNINCDHNCDFLNKVPHWDVINEMVDEGAENHTFYLDHSGDPLIR